MQASRCDHVRSTGHSQFATSWQGLFVWEVSLLKEKCLGGLAGPVMAVVWRASCLLIVLIKGPQTQGIE